MNRHPFTLLLTALLLLPFAADAQTVGGKVPPYQPPAKAAPPASAETGADLDRAARPDPFRRRDEVVLNFAESYAKGGRPRLAFYWNRQLTDTLTQWHSDSRTVSTARTTGATDGDYSLKQQRTTQTATETQRRTAGSADRDNPEETWEWEFQDGFVSPFLNANAEVMDRAAILRIMGAGAEDFDPRTVEVMALQTMSDLLVEVLVADSAKSGSGYELRARILDVRTGTILAMVNSRSLPEWRKDGQAVATARGFDLPDEDDDSFGPERHDQRYRATSSGFERGRKPPRIGDVARNLAYNVMIALTPRLENGPSPAPAALQPPVPVRTPAATEAKPAANDSALPLPDVEAKPLPAPVKPTSQAAAPAVPSDEPPMPRPTVQ
ncbi:hypothetical protein [Magnetospirillum sp. SS-4]|uniref:hypothetical protein n=1 Tax=Magnetospirillum sp. SS-4 TaxID=2681465 RepID=UPI001385EA9C|nr:hypothetical protein [Magnetospirillum sp. SS-4]CAA7626318.1 conserved exported hypothetical protein [Magnetospirillum sp. SS-4]